MVICGRCGEGMNIKTSVDTGEARRRETSGKDKRTGLPSQRFNTPLRHAYGGDGPRSIPFTSFTGRTHCLKKAENEQSDARCSTPLHQIKPVKKRIFSLLEFKFFFAKFR